MHAQDLNDWMLERRERLWLDPDWDEVKGHKKSKEETVSSDREQE